MPLTDSILNLHGFEIEDISGLNPVVLKARYTELPECIHCGGTNLRIKDTFRRWIRHESLGTRKVYLYLKVHKYFCRNCRHYFNSRFPGILPYKRTTEAFRKEVYEKHHDGISQKTLSERLGIADATVERWFQTFLKLKLSRKAYNPCPRVLGIDEHFFTKKDGYATTFCDVGNRGVYDVVLGRSEQALGPYFRRLAGREKVKVVIMDLSETYRSLIRRYIPKAKIVADRFHVIRLVNHHFMKLWQLIDPEGRKNRGLLSLMRRHEEKLRPEQRVKLFAYFIRFQALEAVWQFKQRLCRLLLTKHRTKKQCKALIPLFLRDVKALKDSPFEPLSTLGKTLDSWNEEVVRMWRFSKSNGVTEGFHNKMEMISRRAFGFRNFQNYRLRVRTLCG
jgi:transposase